MLQITDAASAHLHKSLASVPMSGDGQGKCFRVVPKDDESQLTLQLAKPAASDTVLEHEGTAVLAVPKSLEQYFIGRQLDVDDQGKLLIV